jgi:hypothetical protein
VKKALLVSLLIVVAMGASCQTVVYKSQATLQWAAVTQDSGGNAFLPTDVVRYEVYIYNYVTGVVDPQNPAQLTYMGMTAALEQLIVFPYRTTWAAGVRVKMTDGGGNVSYSPIAWSYIVADADVVAGPFVYSPSALPKKPGALRDKGM